MGTWGSTHLLLRQLRQLELSSLEPAADDPARQWVVAQLSGVLGQTEAERSVDERAAASRALDLWSALG